MQSALSRGKLPYEIDRQKHENASPEERKELASVALLMGQAACNRRSAACNRRGCSLQL